MQAETDAAIARLNAIAAEPDPDELVAIAEACENQPEPDAEVAEVVPFQGWEYRPSPGGGPLVEAIARGWNRHWHACRSARLRVADAIAQRIDPSLERLYPAPL